MKVRNLFRIDARSDISLDGKTLEEVRQCYLDWWGGTPMNTAHDPWRNFLLADERVLADPELEVINVVAADYDPVVTIPKNNRYGPQRWFGWVTSTYTILCSSILFLYRETWNSNSTITFNESVTRDQSLARARYFLVEPTREPYWIRCPHGHCYCDLELTVS